MATKQATKAFIDVIKNRRTIYHLSKKPVLSDQSLVQLVQTAVREAPSSFNVQSSRVVVLLGENHDDYWGNIVPQRLKEVAGDHAVQASEGKLQGFKNGSATILFFEDSKLIKGQQEAFPRYADLFPHWSDTSSGMAQIYTWAILESEGYGCNLQHYGNITAEVLKKKYSLPDTYDLKAEMVAGFPESPAGEKSAVPDHERVVVHGGSSS